MNDNGFIYALINPSMEGLIKVGKTTREPKERAEELSKATGVPTPFIVAYEMYVNDCSKGEEFVHTWLESKGYRVADNREFFNAPLTEAINAIMEYKNQLDKSAVNTEAVHNTNSDVVCDPGQEVQMLAHEYYYGWGDKLQDYSEALKYYKQAAKLGSLSAFCDIGNMYKNGEGCQQDIEQAISYYKEGANRGHNDCNASLMDIYFDMGHIDNAQKCWNRYIDNIKDTDSLVIGNYYNYLRNTFKHNTEIQHLDILEKHKDEILNKAVETYGTWKASGANQQM